MGGIVAIGLNDDRDDRDALPLRSKAPVLDGRGLLAKSAEGWGASRSTLPSLQLEELPLAAVGSAFLAAMVEVGTHMYTFAIMGEKAPECHRSAFTR